MGAPPTDRRAEFSAFFDQHWSDVLAYARRRTATMDDAHDLAAETFTTAWRRFDDIPADRAVPWLFRTARLCLANQRRSGRRRLALVDRIAAEPTARTAPPADDVVFDQPLFDAFATLTDEQQELLRLVAWEGLDHLAIAEVLDISPNAVASRLKRARQRFEAALADAVSPDGGPRRDRTGGPRRDRTGGPRRYNPTYGGTAGQERDEGPGGRT